MFISSLSLLTWNLTCTSCSSENCGIFLFWWRFIITKKYSVTIQKCKQYFRIVCDVLCFDNRVQCTLVQALRLCTGCMAYRGSRGIALSFHDHGTRREWGVSVMPQPLFTPGKDPVTIVQEAGWAPGPVWTRAENLAPTGIRSQTIQA